MIWKGEDFRCSGSRLCHDGDQIVVNRGDGVAVGKVSVERIFIGCLVAHVENDVIHVGLVAVIFDLVDLVAVGNMRQKEGGNADRGVLGDRVQRGFHFSVGFLSRLPTRAVAVEKRHHAEQIDAAAGCGGNRE